MILTKQCHGLGMAQLQCQMGQNALGGLVLFYGMQQSLIRKLEFSSSYVVRRFSEAKEEGEIGLYHCFG